MCAGDVMAWHAVHEALIERNTCVKVMAHGYLVDNSR